MARPLNNFFSQFQNYVAGITVLVRDFFLFSPSSTIKILVFSVLGTTFQAIALVATFVILRNLRDGLHINLSRMVPLIDAKVHVTVLLAGVMMLLGLAVFLLYLAEKVAFGMSRRYADHFTVEWIESFPLVAALKKNPPVHPRTGLPATFTSGIKKRNMILEIAVRNLLGAPKSFLQMFYGMGFLLYLEPRLTLFLAGITAPLLVPLNRLTRRIKDAESERQRVSSQMRADAEMLALENSRLPSGLRGIGRRRQELFDGSSYAASNYYRCRRVTGQAATKAVAGAALVIAGVGCMLYFGLLYGGRTLPIALIIVYAGALRMAIMSGRQSVARVAAYARFYDRVQGFFNDRAKAALPAAGPYLSRSFGLKGEDLSKEDGRDTVIKGNGPFAVIGTFPLLSLNRYLFATLLPRINKRKRQAAVAGMAVVLERPWLGQNVSWRDFLGVAGIPDETLRDRLASCCRLLNDREVFGHLDEPVSGARELTPSEAIEAVLLRIWFLGIPIVAVRNEALGILGAGAVGHWKAMLQDRLVLVYYRHDAPAFGQWGESHAVLIGNGGDSPIGLASVEWLNANPHLVKDLLRAERAVEEEAMDDAEWDDAEDED